jgi:hypothetical protein
VTARPLPRCALWTMSPDPGVVLDGALPLLCRGSALQGRKLVGDPAALSWCWTAPGAVAAFDLRTGPTIADVELESAKHDRRWSLKGRADEDEDLAAKLATRAVAVTSHGYAGGDRLEHALRPFAEAGCWGVPQVYDSNRSAEPLVFLRRCLAAWRRLGFPQCRLVPLLGLDAGERRVLAWIRECDRLGLDWHLWSLDDWTPRWAELIGPRLGPPAA